ncbi:GNAT family N-acetyltransferase [bacterium]|nr:GNAT family N-acetyltransferase [bacterium]
MGFPRDIRESFKLNGECIELIATQGSKILGGLVANWISPTEVELRHIAIRSEFQGKSIGFLLVKKLIETVKDVSVHTSNMPSLKSIFNLSSTKDFTPSNPST